MKLAQKLRLVRGEVIGGSWTPYYLNPVLHLDPDNYSTQDINSISRINRWRSSTDPNIEFHSYPNAEYGPYNENDGSVNNKRVAIFQRDYTYLLESTSAQTATLLSDVSSAWGFFVARKLDIGASSSDQCFISFAKNDTEQTRFIIGYDCYNLTSNQITIGGRRLDVIDKFTYTASLPGIDVTKYHMALGIIDYVNDRIDLWIDGLLNNSKTNAFDSGGGNTSNTPSYNNRVCIGGPNAAVQSYIPASLATLMIGTNRVPTENEINKLFGYYAHYYTLTDLLPSDHPYKTTSP